MKGGRQIQHLHRRQKFDEASRASAERGSRGMKCFMIVCLQEPRKRGRSLSLSHQEGGAFAYRHHHHPSLPALDFAG